MVKKSENWIVLLRAIGPATHKKMSMQQLRDDCSKANLDEVRTYIASGNLLCKSSLPKSKLQALIVSILDEYGLDNDVFIRRLSEMKSLLQACPLPQAANERPNHLLTVFFDRKIDVNAAEELRSRDFSENIVVLERELCIYYINGVARSKLTPAVVEKAIGQSGTARNWNTVGKLVAMMDE